MQKILGVIFVITGSLGMGYFYIEKEEQKIAFIEMWDNILSMFANEIAYKKQSLAFAAYEIGKKLGGKEGECFGQIYQRMVEHNREGFSFIWKDEWGKYFKCRKVSQKERGLIEEFVNVTGFDDEEILVGIIEEQQKKWRNLRIEIAEGQRERKKIIWTLSMCFSLMLILILI